MHVYKVKTKKVLFIDRYTYGKPKVIYYSGDETVSIGRFCSIAEKVTCIISANHHTDWVSSYPFSILFSSWSKTKNIQGASIRKGSIEVGSDVWIGYGATILAGVKVGHGAVIGAGALVAKDVEPYSIVVGNPAKEIKKRFTDDQINKLLKIKWWDWSLDKIKDNVDLICDSKIDGFINKFS